MKARYVLVVAVLVLTAGCLGGGAGTDDAGNGAGDGGDGGDANGGDASGDDGGDTGGDANDGGSGDGDDSGVGDGSDGSTDDGASSDVDGEWEPFSFDQPARYEYDVFIEGEGTGSIVWDVKSVEDGQYTVELVYEMNGERTATTATGSRDTVIQQFYSNPGGVVLLTTTYTPAVWYQDRDLSPGTKWSYTTPQGSASFAMTGADRVGGVDCARSEMRVNETIVHEGCFAPDLGLAPHAAWYGDDGQLEMSVTLTDYQEN